MQSYPALDGTKKRRRFNLNSQCQAAFDSPKKVLVSDSIVRYSGVDLHNKLYMDARKLCAGTILCQTHEEGVEYVVQHVSHRLLSTQQSWATVEKEAYAVVYTLQKLRTYLYGAEFVLYTYHKLLL